jgi:imidazoleglycerol-phosphate dehydratase
MNARMTLNVALLDGANSHHIAEATFKAVARALREAIEADPRAVGIPSTKGTLTE